MANPRLLVIDLGSKRALDTLVHEFPRHVLPFAHAASRSRDPPIALKASGANLGRFP